MKATKMPKEARTHDENCLVLCLLCLTKGSQREKCRPLTTTHMELIEKNIYPRFCANKIFLPKAICSPCRRWLESSMGSSGRPCPGPEKFDELASKVRNSAPVTRNNPLCQCPICILARKNAATSTATTAAATTATTTGKATATTAAVTTGKATGATAIKSPTTSPRRFPPSPQKRPPQTRSAKGALLPPLPPATATTKPPSASPSPSAHLQLSPSIVRMCEDCFSKIGRGQKHSCNRDTLIGNLKRMLSQEVLDILSYDNIKEKLEASGGSEIQFYTSARPKTLHVTQKTDVKRELFPQVSSETMMKVKTLNSLSDSKTLKVAQILREGAPRGVQVVESHLRKKIVAKGKELNEFFAEKTCTFLQKKEESSSSIEKPLVFCNNLSELVKAIAEKRGLKEGEYDCKVGLDSGGAFLKVQLQQSKHNFHS